MDIRLIIYASILSSIIAAGAYIKSTIEDNASLSLQNAQWKANYEELDGLWKEELKRIEERDFKLKEAQRDYEYRIYKLQGKIEQERRKGDKCLDAAIPDSILDGLRSDSGKTGVPEANQE